MVVSECVLGSAAIRASQDVPKVTLGRENIPAVAHLLLQTGWIHFLQVTDLSLCMLFPGLQQIAVTLVSLDVRHRKTECQRDEWVKMRCCIFRVTKHKKGSATRAPKINLLKHDETRWMYWTFQIIFIYLSKWISLRVRSESLFCGHSYEAIVSRSPELRRKCLKRCPDTSDTFVFLYPICTNRRIQESLR